MITPSPTNPVWISLGSNLGDRRATLDAAVAALARVPGVDVKAVSRYHETKPVGGPSGQGPFLNAAARLDTTLTPIHLLAATQTIEDDASRTRTVRWGERTLDIDLLIYGAKFLDTPELKLPHPRLALRRFVLAPLVEIAPDIVDTISKRKIANLLANLDRMPRLLTLHGPPTPLKAEVFQRLVEGLPALGIRGGEVPEWAEKSDEARWKYRHAIARQFEALDGRRWPDPSDHDFWRVALFQVDPDWFRYHKDSDPEVFAEFLSLDELLEQRRKEQEFKERIQTAQLHALTPTFVVILPDSNWPRMPGYLNGSPTLWPESDEPEAIVNEILATCQGITEI